MTIDIKAVDQLGNKAHIRQSSTGGWYSVSSDGSSSSLISAGIDPRYDSDCRIVLERARTAEESLDIVKRYGHAQTTYTIFAPEVKPTVVREYNYNVTVNEPTPDPVDAKTIKPGFRVAADPHHYATVRIVDEKREFHTLDGAYAKYINDALAAYEPEQAVWGNHPDFPVADWVNAVASNDTRLGYSDWVQAKLAEPVVREYLFDVKLFASVRVKAISEADARQMMKDHIDASTANLGAWPSGDPIVCEVSLDDPANDELVEVDGEAI